MLYPGGGRREYEYDPLLRITRILAKDPGKNIVLDSSYTYDNIDNILSKQTGQGTYDYTYDALYRLTDVQVDIPGVENEGFGYDAVGNRLTEDGVEGEWTYNANNELLAVATTEYTYDANGNATQLLLDGMVMFTYHYNAQDRLVKVDNVNGNTIAEYVYDPFGRRLWKDVGGTLTYFFYSHEGLVAEYDENGIELKTYGYRPGSVWTTDPLWLKQGTEYYFYQNDHLGTPQKLTAVNGAVVWQATYRSFGKAQVEIETVINNLRFPGHYFDAETGLHYNYHRYYEPEVGRYLNIDPIGFNGGINFYTYGQNDPINTVDPYGLDEFYFTIKNSKGELSYKNKKGETLWTVPANSGRESGLNNPSEKKKPNIGPTLPGKYTIDLSNNAEPDKTATDGRGWGLYGWRLKESLVTKIKRKIFTKRDGGFYLHQDEYDGNATGTAGCLGVTGTENIEQVKKVLEEYSKKKKTIKVIVDY